MKREKRFVGVVGICIVIVVGLNPFTTFAASPASEPFKIGFICSITGVMTVWGTGARDATLVAVDKINAAGGIHGRPLKVIIYDDESNVRPA